MFIININITSGKSYANVEMPNASITTDCIDLNKSVAIRNKAKDGNDVTAEFANCLNTPFVAICAAYDGDNLAEIKFIEVTKDIQTCIFEFEGEWSKFKLFAWDSIEGQNNLGFTEEINE